LFFFIKPHKQSDRIDYGLHYGYYLYDNCYDKNKLESFVRKMERVSDVFWTSVNEGEVVLHVTIIVPKEHDVV
jgi:hypothetical protein